MASMPQGVNVHHVMKTKLVDRKGFLVTKYYIDGDEVTKEEYENFGGK